MSYWRRGRATLSLWDVIQFSCYLPIYPVVQFKIGNFCSEFGKCPLSLSLLSPLQLPFKITNHVPSTMLGSFCALFPLIFTTAL